MPIDFLIIGQGLAGSLLAWELLQRGCRVVVVDNGEENASQVAGGVINPVTGMRFVKTEGIDYLLPSAEVYYTALSNFFRQNFYNKKPLLKIFQSEKEALLIQKRLQDPQYRAFWQASKNNHNLKGYPAPLGFVLQKQTGFLATQFLLARLKQFFIEKGCYINSIVDYQAIHLSPVLQWQNLNPQRIIFCEGYRAINNPWFAYLPFQPVKGEILTLAQPTRLPDTIVNNGYWLLPTSTEQFRLGATFDRENLDTQPTEAGKQVLLAALQSFANNLTTATVLKHQAGVRPCTLDKQPFIGLHPRYPRLAIFNGFGAKGSLQIPWYSQRFADALLNSATIPSSIDRYNERVLERRI